MNRIKEIRKERDITLQQLADLVGTSLQQIQRLEAGKRRLTQEWMDRIGKALDVHPWLLIEAMPVLSDNVDQTLEAGELTAWCEFYLRMSSEERAFAIRWLEHGFGSEKAA